VDTGNTLLHLALGGLIEPSPGPFVTELAYW